MTTLDTTFTTPFWIVVALTLFGALGCFGYAELQLLSTQDAPAVATQP